MNLHQIADRIRSGTPLVIGDAVYSMTRVRERAEENPDYQGALWLAKTGAHGITRIMARKKAAELWEEALYMEAADALADYRAFPQFLMIQAA